MSRAKKLDTRYATAIAVVYDTTCGHCCCNLPEHHSGKIRSELRFDAMPPTEAFAGWSRNVTAFPLDREKHQGPMRAQAVRNRAAIFAALIGVPLLDETHGAGREAGEGKK